MKFRSRKGYMIAALFGFLLILSIITLSGKAYIAVFILIAVMSYLVWMWYDTYYLIDGDQLFYKSALLRGSIDISSIVKIAKNEKIFAGIKPSLSGKGVVVSYLSEDIFMSPIDIDRFITALKEVNPGIRINE
jgi:hypothetical protein